MSEVQHDYPWYYEIEASSNIATWMTDMQWGLGACWVTVEPRETKSRKDEEDKRLLASGLWLYFR